MTPLLPYGLSLEIDTAKTSGILMIAAIDANKEVPRALSKCKRNCSSISVLFNLANSLAKEENTGEYEAVAMHERRLIGSNSVRLTLAEKAEIIFSEL
jgi:hypothetical protein